MADGLLSSALGAIDRTKQALGARFGLLASNPEEFARQLAAETRARTGAGLIGEPKTAQEMASGNWINTPYGKQAIQAFSIAAPIAYHGSPYIFDKFDISKVGTGEKNQAQGWGVYLSESMPYAEGFARKELTGAPNVAYRVKSGGEDPMVTLKQIFPNKSESWYREQVSKANEKGSLYTVDLPDKYVPKMLDYDKEIKYQPKIVQDIAKKYGIGMDDIGLDLINKVGRTKEGSEALLNEGLLGVKYFIDNGKQKATNYVVFDPSILNILSKK
jgi:hypothetical protein